MAKVKTVESSQEFLALLEKSRLLSDEQLAVARQVCAATEDPKAAARQLLKEGLLTNWQATQLLGGFAALLVGKYKLLDPIGKGESSRIYLAEHAETGQRVALKTLVGKTAGDPQVEEFLTQARAATTFEHPHVVRVVDISSAEERPFVATEFVAQGDLQQIVDKNGPLAPRVAANLIAQAAEGMAYVHSLDLLHRDLKPANLLVQEQPSESQFAGVEPAEKTYTVKILGAGMGPLQFPEKPSGETTGELSLSALGYTSPEQVRAKETDARSDIYALGGTLYFLLTGRVPYTAGTNEERDTIRKTKRPVPVTTLKADAPVDLANLCDQMMALRPADRPGSMTEVADRLRQWLRGSFESAGAAAAPVEAMPAETESEAGKIPEAKLEDVNLAEINLAEINLEEGKLEGEKLEGVKSAEATPADATQSIVPSETVKISIGGQPAEGMPVAPSGFKIHKKKKAEISESLSASSEENADPALAAVANKAKRQRLILIGSAAASLLVIVISLAVMMLTSDDQAKQTAAGGAGVEGGAAAAPETAAAKGPSDPNDPENLPDPETIPDAAVSAAPAAAESVPAVPPATSLAAVPAVAPTATPAGATAAVPASAPAAPASAPAAPPASTPVGAPTAPATAAASPPASAAVSAPAPSTTASPPAAAAPAVATAPTAPTPPATTPPATTPAVTTAAAVPATPAPAPAAPATPPAAPPPAAPAASPVRKGAKTFEIATAVDLPKLPSPDGSGSGDPPVKVLGKVNIDPKDACFLALQGGDKAMRGRNAISLRNSQGGTAPRDWEVVQKETSGEDIVVATLSLPAQELRFEWTPDGLKSPSAGALRNCVLKITAGQEKPHLVALRTVSLAPPITIENLEKANLSARFALESLPDSSALRMEPTVPNQKIVFDAGGTDLTKGDQWIYFGESKEQAPLALKLDTGLTAKGIQVSAVPYVLLPGEKPQKLTPALYRKISVTDLQKQSNAMTERLGNMKKQMAKMARGAQASMQNELNLTNLQRENLDKLVQRVQKLDELVKQLNSGGKIHFRIYYDSGESPVELVKTDDAAPPAGR